MFLTAKIYLSEYNEESKEKSQKVAEIFPDIKLRVKEICFELGYWRKANAIHKWFVDETQEGEDECNESYVSIEQLRELKELCKKELAEKDNEDFEGVLETQSGFFFGSTEKDEWFYNDMENTIKIIDEAEKIAEKCDFYYRASW